MNVVSAPAGYVLGDGSTAGATVRRRWRSWRLAIWVTVSAIGLFLFLALVRGPTSEAPLSTKNARPDGARAVAEVLRSQGVAVDEVEFLIDAGRILRQGDTLVVSPGYLLTEQMDSILAFDGTVVLLSPSDATLWEIGATSYLGLAPSGGEGERSAECDAPAALKAGSVSSLAGRDISDPGWPEATTCFPGTTAYAGAYVVLDRSQGDLHLLADASMVTNKRIDEYGHAALALNTMGTSGHVVWYLKSPYDNTTLSAGSSGERDESRLYSVYAPWIQRSLGALLLLGLAAAVWRGRRMGKLVTERLPVVVRQSEATRGRGRLYRQAQARGHAAAALRAGAVARMASRLGLPRTAAPTAVLPALATATGRDEASLDLLIYGPPPATDAALVDLVAALDDIERKVHRP